MKRDVYEYKIVGPKVYSKTCLKCGRRFESVSRNKRLCSNCAETLNRENNVKRVQKYYKKNPKTPLGTGRLKGKPKPPIKEIDYIIEEMKYLRLF